MREAGVANGDTLDLSLPPFTVRIALPASLRDEYGDTILLTTSPSASAHELKRLLQEQTGLSDKDISLAFEGTMLAGGTTMREAGVANGDTLDLSLGAPAPWLLPHSKYWLAAVLAALLALLVWTLLRCCGRRQAAVLPTTQPTPPPATQPKPKPPPPPRFAIIVDFGTPELAERASQYLAKQPAAALKRAGLSRVSGVAGPAAAGQQAAVVGIVAGKVGQAPARGTAGALTLGAGLRLEASSAMSVGELQAKLREVTGMEAAAQVLTYGGTQLATSSAQTLGDAGVRSGDHLNLAPFTVRIALPASLRGMYGDAITLTTSPLASVRELKRVLQKRTGLTIAEMTLVFGGATLADDVMLQRAGVVSGDTLDLSLPAYVIHIDMPAWLEPKHGDFSRMYVTSAMTTAELHGEVATLTGLKRAQQQLTFKQRLLAPSEETLAQLGIESHDTISLQYLGNDGVADTTLHHTAMQLTYATQLSLKCTDSAEAVRGTPRAARAQAAAPAASQRGSSARS